MDLCGKRILKKSRGDGPLWKMYFPLMSLLDSCIIQLELSSSLMEPLHGAFVMDTVGHIGLSSFSTQIKRSPNLLEIPT